MGIHALVLEPGKVIASKYLLERPAGFGGMAQLWVATNQATGAEVCVKLLVPDRADGTPAHAEEESIARFRREAHAAASLNHRAIIRVFDLLELDALGETARSGAPHAYGIVMELLRGETLGDLLAKRGKVPLEEALDLVLPVISALAHAHRAAVIHRDIKPDNIFLARDPDGHLSPKVLDFGVSKRGGAAALTIEGVVVGTPSFMSPEQAKGARDVDARSDVFSAGLLFYLMLTGSNPFEAASFAGVVDAVVRLEAPPIADLPPPIWAALHRALEKDPALRFSNATEMGIALRSASGRKSLAESSARLPLPPLSSRRLPAADSGIAASPSGTSDSAAAFDESHRRRRAIVAGVLGAALAVVLVSGMIVAFDRSRSTSPIATKPATTKEAPPRAAAPSPDPPIDASAVSAVASAITTMQPPTNPAPTTQAPSRRPAPKRPPLVPSGRKPGEEPNNARDPGF